MGQGIGADLARPCVEIGGSEYALLMSDGEICAQGARMAARCRALANAGPKALADIARELRACLAEMLGEEAVAAIYGGAPVRACDALTLLAAIVTARARAYGAYLRQYTDGDGP